MNKQLIFCLETNRKANTDWIYIQELLRKEYPPNASVKFTPVYMGSKQKYNSKGVKRDIKEKVSMYPGESYILMCIDTDNFASNPIQRREFDGIEKYCEENHYHLIWFNIDIEDVFQGHRIDSKSKVAEAAKFQRNKLIEKIDLSLFKKNKASIHGSNLCNILKDILGE